MSDWQTRELSRMGKVIETQAAEITRYRGYLEQRLGRLLAESHAIGESTKCAGCREATEISGVLSR